MGALFVHDGDCGFCRKWSGWLAARAGPSVRFAAYQSVDDLAALGLTEDDVRAASWFVADDGPGHGVRPLRGSDAFAAVFRTGRGPWRLAGFMLAAPGLRWVGRLLYAAVARNRHRLPAPDSDMGA